MHTHNLKQGSAEWHAHRRGHRNASDAPAMLSCSPYKTRTELLQETHTGLSPEVNGHQQRRFDDGHRFEALALPLAEDIVGEDLSPVVGTAGKMSASFDGLNAEGTIGFEHKTLNDQLRAALISDAGADALPKAYRVQMEQQCMVSGAERILFMASKWNGDDLVEEMHAWYEPDAELRAEIIAGWEQFERDLASFEPQAAVIEKIVAEPVEALPAPMVQITGQLTLKDNFRVFEVAVRNFIEHRLIREPKTDQDFADLDVQIKAMKGARESLKANKAQMWAQVQPIDQANKTTEMLDDLLQTNLSMAQRILDGEKERRKGEIVAGGVSALDAHIAALNKRLGRPFMPKVPVDFGGAIKGLKSLASMENKVDAALNQARLAANATADRIDANLKHLAAEAGEFLALFPDVSALVLKEPQDFEAQVQFRVADQRAKDAKRAEEQRQRIAEEERVKAEAKMRAEQEARRRADAAAEQATQVVQTAATTPPPASPITTSAAVAPLSATPSSGPTAAPAVIQMPKRAAAAPATAPTLSLGQISTRLGFQVTAAFLASLGFTPAGRERASVLFHEADFGHICAAIVAHIQSIQAKQAA